MTGDSGRYLIRSAAEADLDVLATFEVEIAVASFGDEAIVDPAFHRRRIAGALGKPGEIALVAVAEPAEGAEPAGRAEQAEGAEPAGRAGPAGRAEQAEEAAEVALGDDPIGWAWMSARTNSLTGERYGNFRSLAVAQVTDRGAIGELLMTAILDHAAEAGLSHLSGKVNAANLGMRALYRAFGFTATHLTMEKRVGS